jgi:hypothetical protein
MWAKNNMHDRSGKTVIVTGANLISLDSFLSRLNSPVLNNKLFMNKLIESKLFFCLGSGIAKPCPKVMEMCLNTRNVKFMQRK